MDKILVSEEGYQQFYDKLNELKKKSNLNGVSLSKSYNDYVGDGWHDNPVYEEAMRKNRMIDKDIETMIIQSKKLKLINDAKKIGYVNIGDVLKVEFIYSLDNREEEIIKITGKYIPNTDLDIEEITLNSPIGRAIYKEKIGNTCFYEVGEKKFSIRIVEKVNI